MKKLISLSGVVLFLLVLTQITSCKKDEKDPDVIASFSFAQDAVNFMKVTFTNQSSNYSALLWNFGDGSATSTEVNPVHTYTGFGDFTVTLTATALNGTDVAVHTKVVSITDPDAELTKLVGEVSKTWKLIRDVSTGRYPLEVGPYDHSAIWWAFGLNEDLAVRPCMLNDEWIFQRDGNLVFDDLGDYWAEGSIYPEGSNNACYSSDDPMVNVDGVDVSAWSSGTHQFVLSTASGMTLQLTGTGAYLGLAKVASTAEVIVPQSEVTYEVIALTEGSTDTLIVETKVIPAGETNPTAYWRFVLVHYDDPNDEPPLPDPLPTAGFTYVLDGYTATFTNTSTLATSYSWDFGDGATSTDEDPVHTYAADGIYDVTLTAINANGQKSTTQSITITSAVLTEEVLTDGPWMLQVSDHSIYVGSGLGNDDWFIVPLANLDGTNVGTPDDWSCMATDEFIFSTGGGYEYKTNGSTRNDGYMGSPNGCWSDAEIAASPGAPFGSCATHTFSFTPATETERAMITLTNGTGFAAFIGFMKGYYGGENTDNANPPNGGNATNQYEVIAYGELDGKEFLIVSVDITADHSGTAAWTATLER